MTNLNGKTILLVISGGIAAYKSLELIRLIRKAGGAVRCILTKGGAQFVTPLSVSALCEHEAYTDLWSLKDETEMGHIRLSREADLVLIAPASANMIAKLAHGLADDLASTTLLANDKPVLLAPAMNHMMWDNPATQANIQTLQDRGVMMTGPVQGDMACGETGMGRMAEPDDIFEKTQNVILSEREGSFLLTNDKDSSAAPQNDRALIGLSAIVTSGPTHEPLDPVRFIGNRSSGKQGHAIATALAAQGASVTLISGPVALPDPTGVKTIHVQTAVEMHDAARSALPADIAVCAAAVSDWSAVAVTSHKIKKRDNRMPPDIKLKENPDILAAIAQNPRNRPRLVIGFAAETENLIEAAQEKRRAKGCDWIVANDVSADNVFGQDENKVFLVTDGHTEGNNIEADGVEEWDKASKALVASKLTDYIASYFAADKQQIAAE